MKAFGMKAPAAIEEPPPPFPDRLDYLWVWFNEISLGVASSGMAPPQITWTDVFSWCQLNDVGLEPWESRTIVLLGTIRANIQSKKLQDKHGKHDQVTPKTRPGRKPKKRG